MSPGVSPDPKICSTWRSIEMRLTARLADGAVASSLSAARRENSTATVDSAARTVDPRLRPEISPTSPKMDPVPIGTVTDLSDGSTSTSTEPSAMANIDEPGSLRLKMTSSRP